MCTAVCGDGLLLGLAAELAELVKEQTIGEQTAAFQRDMQVKEAEQAMRISVAEANAKAVDGDIENLAQTEVRNAGHTIGNARCVADCCGPRRTPNTGFPRSPNCGSNSPRMPRPRNVTCTFRS